MVDHRGHHSLFVPPLIQDHIQGVLSARVVLVMYGDYECFQSVNAYRLIKAAQQQLSSSFEENDVCFIFRHFPQIQIHPHAQRAAEAAAMQGQFWQMHELLFTHQQALENGYLVEYANRLGLAISRFLQNLSKGELGEFIGDTAPILAQFLEESRPTLTVIGVSSLASPEILVEIEATVAFQPVQP